MAVRAAWLLPGGQGQQGQTREDTRLAPLGTMAPDGELGSRDGVIAGGDPFAAASAGAMSLSVGAGRAIVQGTAAQGAYPVVNDGPVTVDFSDGDAQFDRIDSVIIRVYDGLYDTSGQTLGAVEILPGTPASAPEEPALPAAALRLWSVTVPAGASAGVGGIDWGSALADRRRYTAAYGGIIPRGWGLGFDGGYDGQYRDNGSALERWDAGAGAWVTYRPPEPAADTTTTGLTVTSGWAVNSFSARRRYGVVTMTAYLSRTGAALAADPNLIDVDILTLPSGWRPVFDFEATASDGYGSGVCLLYPTGVGRLRTWSPGTQIGTGANVRVSATYVQ